MRERDLYSRKLSFSTTLNNDLMLLCVPTIYINVPQSKQGKKYFRSNEVFVNLQIVGRVICANFYFILVMIETIILTQILELSTSKTFYVYK